MNDDLCLLVTLFQSPDSLLSCALQIPHGRSRFETAYLMEYSAEIHALLPPYVASVGPICKIEPIFALHVVPAGEETCPSESDAN